MPEPENQPPEGDDKKFTQADVDRFVAGERRRVEAKFADYDDLKTKAGKFDEAETANKTESQKLADRLAEAERKVDAAEARSLLSEVAIAKGLNPAQAKRLRGTTRDELEADAEELLSTFKPADTSNDGGDAGGDGGDGGKPNPTNRPSPDLKGGGDPGGNGPEPDIKKIVAGIPRF